MTALPLALSISSTFTKIGAIAAFAALVGIAILSLLVFSQAREIKRLREWAGRAPERAADLEQRVSNNAAARVQQVPGATGVQPARPVARAAPIQAQAAAGGAGAATRVVAGPAVAVAPVGQPLTASGLPAAPMPGTPGTPASRAAAPGQPPAPGGAPSSVPGQPAVIPAPGAVPPGTLASPQSPAPGQPASAQRPGAGGGASPPSAAGQPSRTAAPSAPPVGTPASVAGATQGRPVPGAPAAAPASVDPRPPAPATAAAAAAAAPRAPSPPSAASAPRDPGQPVPAALGAPAQGQPAQPAARRPPAPAPAGATRRSDPRAPILAEGRRATYTASRSPRRTAMMVVGGLVAVAAVAVVAVTALGGSSGGKAKTPATARTVTHTTAAKPVHRHRPASKSAAKTAALSPAETTVAVLNATETEGLARRTASSLQQSGYSQAAAAFGKPPGSGQVSLVEYAGGHQAEAEAVAHSAGVTHVQPMEAAVSALANSANVVLIVGADKATQSP